MNNFFLILNKFLVKCLVKCLVKFLVKCAVKSPIKLTTNQPPVNQLTHSIRNTLRLCQMPQIPKQNKLTTN